MFWKIVECAFDLRYVISAKYTDELGENQLHIAKECLVSFSIGLAMPKHSPYKQRVNKIIGRLLSGGFTDKWLLEMNEKVEQEKRQVVNLF